MFPVEGPERQFKLLFTVMRTGSSVSVGRCVGGGTNNVMVGLGVGTSVGGSDAVPSASHALRNIMQTNRITPTLTRLVMTISPPQCLKRNTAHIVQRKKEKRKWNILED